MLRSRRKASTASVAGATSDNRVGEGGVGGEANQSARSWAEKSRHALGDEGLDVATVDGLPADEPRSDDDGVDGAGET